MHNYVFDVSICMVSNMLVDPFRVNVDNMVYRMPAEQMLNVPAVFCKTI